MGILGFLEQKTKQVVGLDISSTSVKLLELSRQGDHFRVARKWMALKRMTHTRPSE